MRRSLHPPAFLLVLLLGGAPLTAQVPGLPVYNAGVPRGIGIFGDLGFPNDDAGGGTAYGVTGRVGLGVLAFTATLSALNPDGPAGTSAAVGATANYRVFGGPLVPLSVTLQAGIGYTSPDSPTPLPGNGAFSSNEITHFPFGLGLALTIPNPALAIKPWLAPRLDVVRTPTTDGDGHQTDTNFGLSGGIELNLLNGFGAHASYDYVNGDAGNPGIFGIGAHYTFRVRGL
jgi:hypothetical protein